MATFTASSLDRKTGFDVRGINIGDLYDYDNASASSTSARFYDNAKNYTEFHGSGFKFTKGSSGEIEDVTGGTIRGVDVVISGTKVFAIADASYSAAKFYDFVEAGQYSAALNYILAGHDKISGTNYADYLMGGAGNDTIGGNSGNDTIYGGAGADRINGHAGNDALYGDAGNDTLSGGGGNDRLDGGAGNDTLNGDAGSDQLNGGAGADKLYGQGGNDKLYGGAGNDTLNGGAGADLLDGGVGDDRLVGGGGADTFVFRSGYGTDTISDFISGEDRIDLSGTSVTDFGSLSMTQNKGTVVITIGTDVLQLANIKIADLDASDFVF